MYDIICDITMSQVDEAEKELGMKICPRNAFLSCYNFDFLAALPREELHQFLIRLYGEYIIQSAFHSITPPGQPNVRAVCADDMQPASAWLEYPFRKSHPILHWLPTKLAAWNPWISDNHGQVLGIPPKGGLEWTAGELNAILENKLVLSQGGKGQLRTFCCIQWECECYSGNMFHVI